MVVLLVIVKPDPVGQEEEALQKMFIQPEEVMLEPENKHNEPGEIC